MQGFPQITTRSDVPHTIQHPVQYSSGTDHKMMMEAVK
jgi:hypothetical protein